MSESQESLLQDEAETSETAFSRFGGTAARRSYGSSSKENNNDESPLLGNVLQNAEFLQVELSQADNNNNGESLFAVTGDNDDEIASDTNIACTMNNSDDDEDNDEKASLQNKDDDSDSDDETVHMEREEVSRGRTKRSVRSVLESAGDTAPSSTTKKQVETPKATDVEISNKQQETTVVEEAVASASSTTNKDNEMATKETPSVNDDEAAKALETEKAQPEEDALIVSIDNLYAYADKKTVTVKDINKSLEAEYDVKFTKATRAFVKTHLKDLVEGNIESTVEPAEPNSESEEEEEASDEGEEYHSESSSDEEEQVAKKKRKTRAKKKTTKRISPRASAKKKKKPSHVRIHAEMLRKRRIEELRVRNEELQVKQSKEDQKRAEQIAAKFETDTDELRLKRLEDRLDLLQKLDQKRIRVISDESTKSREQMPKLETSDKATSTAPPQADQDVPFPVLTEDSDDSDDDFELEIIGKDNKPASRDSTKVAKSSAGSAPVVAKSSAISMLDMVGGLKPKPKRNTSITLTASEPQASPGRSMSARAALRNSLRAKQRKGANMWLARELGYKTQEEHMRDCLLVEQKKREDVVKREEERLKANERKQLRERMLQESNPYEETEEQEYNPDEAEEANGGDEDDGNESDEEMAMARQLEEEQDGAAPPDNSVETSQDDDVLPAAEGERDPPVDMNTDKSKEDDQNQVTSTLEAPSPETESPKLDSDAEEAKAGEEQPVDSSRDSDTARGEVQDDKPSPDDASPASEDMTPPPDDDMTPPPGEDVSAADSPTVEATFESADNDEDPAVSANDTTADSEEETEMKEDSSDTEPAEADKESTAPKDKNAGWKAMLQKEAQKLKKQKAGKNGKGLVEAEADEEEEEEVAGLEDFGFSLGNKKKDDDEEEDADADKITEEDLKHVVDDVSDDEGDEDAGQAARKALEQREEKERHKEIIRRMREGYDGRRGGIAGGGVGARGMHRFDQLVAADNREDAKRLGLLNDDELDSDDEEAKGDGKGDDEEDDENALLDKMLKDRFLHRSSHEEVQENFSSDEEEEEDANEGMSVRGSLLCRVGFCCGLTAFLSCIAAEENKDAVDEDEKEQERLAKRFSKRARMQRLIEEHGEDEEFSQLRLIDEDDTTRLELKMMKVSNMIFITSLISRLPCHCRQSSPNLEYLPLYIHQNVSQMSRDTSGGSSSRTASQSSDSREGTAAVFGVSTKRSSSLALGTSSLSLALQASRTMKKKKTSFLGGAGASKELSSSVHKCVSMGHVVFNTGGDSQLSKAGGQSSRSNLGTFNSTKGKRKRSTMQKSTSLWSKVSANGFNKKSRRN